MKTWNFGRGGGDRTHDLRLKSENPRYTPTHASLQQATRAKRINEKHAEF